jgi:hypothetical protein
LLTWSAIQAEIGISAPKMLTSVEVKWSPAQSTTSGMIDFGILEIGGWINNVDQQLLVFNHNSVNLLNN